MAGDRFALRQAREEDADELARLEAACWPEGLAASCEQITARIAAYGDGQWVAQQDGRLLGYSSAQRVHAELLQVSPLRYDIVTDCDRFAATHSDDGEIYQLVGVSTHPDSRGQRIGRRLVDHQVARAWTLRGIRRVLGFTRPAGRHLAPDDSLESYLANHLDGSSPDTVLGFHLDAGAVVVSSHEQFRINDHQCLHSGILIEYLR